MLIRRQEAEISRDNAGVCSVQDTSKLPHTWWALPSYLCSFYHFDALKYLPVFPSRSVLLPYNSDGDAENFQGFLKSIVSGLHVWNWGDHQAKTVQEADRQLKI